MNQKYNINVYKTIQAAEREKYGNCLDAWEIDDMTRQDVLRLYAMHTGFADKVETILHILCMGD